MIETSVTKVEANFKGLVLGSKDAKHFSVGANLKLILNAIENRNWKEIETFMAQFQSSLTQMKKSAFPVVSVPFGLTLGGGLEMVFPSDMSVTVSNVYCGLVEVKAGLIPAGGGCKEMLIKAFSNLQDKTDPIEKYTEVLGVFTTLALGAVSKDAQDAKKLGYLNRSDIIIESSNLIEFAKQKALELSIESYSTTFNNSIPVLGSEIRERLIDEIPGIFGSNDPTEYDIEIVSKLAYIITGGNGAPGKLESEQYFLDLEKEVVLHLCGNEKTADRISHILTTGKPLRN
jgi:3-hydroxyacyl-CoA dehydrogenase